MWEEIKAFLQKDWTCTEKLVLGVLCVLAGVIVGFVWAPVKKGISIRSNNTYCDCDGYDGEEYM